MLSPQPPPTSSSIIANNDDILTQLLVCLPIKSLRRFRCVSKQWCSLISGNYFIQKRRSGNYRHRSINGLFLHRQLDDPRSRDNTWKFNFISIDSNVRQSIIPSTTLNLNNDMGGIKIEQSCNGLLLCSTFKLFGESTRNYYIYNPTTEQYTILPRLNIGKHDYASSYSISLAFNPIKSPHYKVINMFWNAQLDHEIQIYSSETCSWKVSKRSRYLPGILGMGSGVFWNGLLNWPNVSNSLVYFNVERETFGREPMPGYFRSKPRLYFGECKGHLYYVELFEHEDYTSPRIRIYERISISTEWHMKYNIDTKRLREICLNKVGYFYSLRNNFKVLLIDGEEEKEEEYESPKLVLQIGGKVVSCDLKDLASTSKILDREPVVLFVEGDSKVIQAFQYIKSFASV